MQKGVIVRVDDMVIRYLIGLCSSMKKKQNGDSLNKVHHKFIRIISVTILLIFLFTESKYTNKYYIDEISSLTESTNSF